MVNTNPGPQNKAAPVQDRANNSGQASPEPEVPLLFVLIMVVIIVLNLVLFCLVVVGVITFPMPVILAGP